MSQCQLVSVNWSGVSVNWSVSTGQESVSTGQCQPVSVQLVPTLTRNAEQAGPKKKNEKTQKRKQPSNDSTLDLTFSPTFDSASTPVKRMKVSNAMQTSPITPDVTDATTSPFVKETLRQVHELSAPLSKDEEAYLTKLNRIKMNQSQSLKEKEFSKLQDVS